MRLKTPNVKDYNNTQPDLIMHYISHSTPPPYMKHYNNTQHNLIMHYVSHSILPPPLHSKLPVSAILSWPIDLLSFSSVDGLELSMRSR